MTTINTDNITTIIDYMGSSEYALAMGVWGPEVEDGKFCCIAGFACLAKNGKFPDDPAEMRSIASEFIGITGMDAYNLFTPDAWTGAYLTDNIGGIKVLQHLIKTGKVNWQKCK